MKRFISRITVVALAMGSLAAFGVTTASVAAPPITVYVETVLGSETTGVLDVCALTGNFALGQTIVFRAYANDATGGDKALTASNTASATITIAGVAKPIPLVYGNSADSDGRVWWTAALTTGEASGQYKTLGAIPFTVTFVAKSTDFKKVRATKLVKLIKNGKPVVKNGKPVLKRVTYYKRVKVKGAIGTFNSNALPVSSKIALQAKKVDFGTTSTFGADQWISNFSDIKLAANWTLATSPTLTLTAGEFDHEALTLVAGTPYIIEIKNTDTVALGLDGGDLFRASVAWEVKEVWAKQWGGEFKFNLLKEVFVNPGKTIKLWLLPVVPGMYKLNALDATGTKIAGMVGIVNVTGTIPTAPAPIFKNVSNVGNSTCDSNLVSAAIPTWDAKAQKATITLGDTATGGSWEPKETVLKLGVPTILTFDNSKGLKKRIYQMDDFFKTLAVWKITGGDSWNTGTLLRGADVYGGVTVSMYFIPTVAGTYKATDSGPGMSDVSATIVVQK